MKDQASTQVKELPQNVQGVYDPLIESLNTGIHDITAVSNLIIQLPLSQSSALQELGNKDVP